jgi:methionine-rich copper-binding protein CopC
MRLASRLPGGVLVGVLAALVLATPALAHAELVSSTPEDGAVLDTPPTTVTLTFSEGLDAGKSSIRLIGPSGEIASGRPTETGATTMTLDDLALGPGAYTVKWVSAAEDGHLDRGQLGFTVSEPTPPPATPSPAPPTPTTQAPTSSPTTAPATAPPTPAPTGSPAATTGADVVPAAADGAAADVILPIALGLLLVAGVGAFVLRRSRGA